MAEFDPDAFLKSGPGPGTAPAAPAFDPEAFLKGPQSGGAYAAKELAPGQAEQGLRRRKLEELVQAKGEPGYGTRLSDNFTMGLIRPVSGALAAAVPEEGTTAGERYRAAVGAEEDYAKRAERNTNPYLGAAADFVGGAASGGPAAGLFKGGAKVAVEKAPTLGKIIASGAGQGAVEGAARNAESPENAAIGAGVGGAVGGTVAPIVGALANRLPGVQAAKKEVAGAVREGGSEALKKEGGALYKQLDQAGIHFKDTSPLVTDTVQTMADKGFNKELHKELVPALEQIGNLKGKPATWTELQNIRTQLSDARASDDKRVRRMAGHLNDVLDKYIDTAKPTIPIGKLGTVSPGDPAKARDLWRRGSQAENVEYLTEKGMTTATNAGRKLETNFGREIDKVNRPGRFNPIDPENMNLMETIAKGDPNRAKLAEFLRQQSGKLVGLGALGTAAGAGGLYGGDTTGIGSGIGAGGAATLGLGLLGKAGAGRLRQGIATRGADRANDLIRNIVTGSTDRSVVNTPREALAKVLAAEQLKRGASRYSSSFFNKE